MNNFKITVLTFIIYFATSLYDYSYAHPPETHHFNKKDLQHVLDKLDLSEEQSNKIDSLLEKEKVRKAAAKEDMATLTAMQSDPNLTKEQKKSVAWKMVYKMTSEKNMWFKNMMDLFTTLTPEQAVIFRQNVPRFDKNVSSLEKAGILKLNKPKED